MMENNEMAVINKNPERLYSKYYHDFMKSKLFDGKEKIVFLMLKMFGDFRNDNGGTTAQAYPTQDTLAEYLGMTRKTVGKILQSLESKGVVKSMDQGVNKPKLYYIYDYGCLWTSETEEELAEAAKEPEKTDHIRALEAMGYKILPPDAQDAEKQDAEEQKPVKKEKPAASIQPTTDFNSNSNSNINYNKVIPISQGEAYPMDQLKQAFDYDIMLFDYPQQKKMIDSVMNIIYDTMNTSDERIKVQRTFRPKSIVLNRLMKLDKDMIIYVINKYQAQCNRIKYPRAYLLTQLYEAYDQFGCDITNQVNHDLYGA